MDNQRSSLYDIKWQVLRVSCLMENKSDGGFGSAKGTQDNVTRLLEYFDEAERVGNQYEAFMRSYRVLNLMSATLLGYGSRKEGTEEELMVKNLLLHMQTQYARLSKVNSWQPWDWEGVYRDLLWLVRNENKVFHQIVNNMMKRVGTAKRKEAAGTGGMKHRPELEKFLSLLTKSASNYAMEQQLLEGLSEGEKFLATQYIAEAYHQDGSEYMDQFTSVKDLRDDFRLFVENCKDAYEGVGE